MQNSWLGHFLIFLFLLLLFNRSSSSTWSIREVQMPPLGARAGLKVEVLCSTTSVANYWKDEQRNNGDWMTFSLVAMCKTQMGFKCHLEQRNGFGGKAPPCILEGMCTVLTLLLETKHQLAINWWSAKESELFCTSQRSCCSFWD